MAAGAEEEYRKEFHSGSHQGRILGDDRFADKVLAQAEGAPCKPMGVAYLKEIVLREFDCTLAALGTRSQRRSLALARASLGWLAVQTGAATLTEVGKWIGRDVVTMSAAVRRLGKRARLMPEVRELSERLLKELSRQEA